MITNFLLQIPGYLLNDLLSILPAGGNLPSQWVSGVYAIWGYINAFSFIVPVDTLLLCLGIAMTFHLAILGFRLFHWVITKIPFIG